MVPEKIGELQRSFDSAAKAALRSG